MTVISQTFGPAFSFLRRARFVQELVRVSGAPEAPPCMALDAGPRAVAPAPTPVCFSAAAISNLATGAVRNVVAIGWRAYFFHPYEECP
jgi:hypothetical protein